MGLIMSNSPIGIDPSQSILLNMEGASNLNVDLSIMLHQGFSRRFDNGFAEQTGIRMTPLTRDQLAKIATAPKWQVTPESEKEAGGCDFPETREAMGVYADSRGYDLDKAEKVVGMRGKRILYPRAEAIVHGARSTAMNNSTNSDAVAINYLQQFQWLLSIAGEIPPLIENQIDIPAGFATYQIPKLAYGQWLLQGATTTDSYAVNDAITPTTTSQTLSPKKFQNNVFVAGEFSEDSVAPIIPALETSSVMGLKIMLEHCLISGDTLVSTANINSIGITALGTKDPRTAFDGFRATNYKGTINGGGANAMKGANNAGAAATLNMVPEMLKTLGKYGANAKDCVIICPVNVRHQFMQDAKARPDTYQLLVEMKDSLIYRVAGALIVVVGNSLITNGSSGGIPTYAGWISEGFPTNLAADGTYTGSGSYMSAVAVNLSNWVLAWKRRWQWAVINLPLADQVAVSASVRVDAKPKFASVSESVAYNIAA